MAGVVEGVNYLSQLINAECFYSVLQQQGPDLLNYLSQYYTEQSSIVEQASPKSDQDVIVINLVKQATLMAQSAIELLREIIENLQQFTKERITGAFINCFRSLVTNYKSIDNLAKNELLIFSEEEREEMDGLLYLFDHSRGGKNIDSYIVNTYSCKTCTQIASYSTNKLT